MFRKSTPSPLRNRSRSSSFKTRVKGRNGSISHVKRRGSGTFGAAESPCIDEINGVEIRIPELREGNFKMWEADMKVYLAAKGIVDEEIENEEDLEEDSERRIERERKAMVWFGIEEKVRETKLLDLAGREFGAEDLLKRLGLLE